MVGLMGIVIMVLGAIHRLGASLVLSHLILAAEGTVNPCGETRQLREIA